ncbi:MAG: hypothetical protein HY760_00505 [Nitrospirae bacterium]|nr:hypothetical protein [Nitrospirota bacterium]
MNSEPIDKKYKISAVAVEHGHPHTERDAVLFLAKDKALPVTLAFYRSRCAELGARQEQLIAIDLLIVRVMEYQDKHPEEVKVADINPENPACSPTR